MMTEEEYIARLQALWLQSGQVPRGALAIADDAVKAFPNSAMLCLMRGQLIAMASEHDFHSPKDARECFEKAIELDPHFANAYQELGNYHAGYGNDPETALIYFKKAEQLRQAGNNPAQARL
jgi:tetratricopeptide (TPR) repeat protein